jgi:hypothetical protein
LLTAAWNFRASNKPHRQQPDRPPSAESKKSSRLRLNFGSDANEAMPLVLSVFVPEVEFALYAIANYGLP